MNTPPLHVIYSLQAALRAGMIDRDSKPARVWASICCKREHLDAAVAWLRAQ